MADSRSRANRVIDDDFGSDSAIIGTDVGCTRYKVEHTLVSFGEDIANLLGRKLYSFAKLDLDSRFWRGRLAKLLLVFMALSVSIALSVLAATVIGGFVLPAELASAGNWISVLQAVGLYVYAILLIAVVVTVAAIGSFLWFSEVPPSFVILSESARKVAERRARAYAKRKPILVLSLIGSLMLGVVGSLIATGVWEVFSG